MATLNSHVHQYFPDFINDDFEISLKIRAGVIRDCNLLNRYPYRDKNCICAGLSALFKPRHLQVTFYNTGSPDAAINCLKVNLPIGTLGDNNADLIAIVQELKLCGAVCIDLIGEEWTTIPQSLAPLGENTGSLNPTFSAFTEKTTGTFKYQSPILGTVTAGVIREPVNQIWEITTTQCLGASFTAGKSVRNVGYTPRQVTVKGIVTADDTNGITENTWVRKVPIASSARAEIEACIKDLALVEFVGIQALGYKGESVKNLQVLIN